jgi:Gpi18-like mannosyltransferase
MRYQLVMSFFAAVVVFWSLYHIVHNAYAATQANLEVSRMRFLRNAGLLILVAVAAVTASVAHWQYCADLSPSTKADTWYCG